MTQEQIEGDVAIALFMGGKLKHYNISNEPYYQMPNKQQWMPERLIYHSDWNWLMEVVEKIESMRCNEGNFEIFIFKRCCDIQTNKGTDHIIEITAATSKIEAVWIAITEFIQWHNSQVKSTPLK